MNVNKLGSAQRGIFVQPGANSAASAAGSANAAPNASSVPTSANAASSSTAASGVTGVDAPRAGMRRRIEGFVEHADRRLDSLMRQPGLSERQLEALRGAQKSFHSQMGRLDHALDGGAANGAMHNILTNLSGSIDAILREPVPSDIASRGVTQSTSPGTTSAAGGSANEIDTLA